MIQLHPEILSKDGKPQFAVLPYEEFLQLQAVLARAAEKQFEDPRYGGFWDNLTAEELVGTAAVYRGAGSEFIYPDLMMKCRAMFSDSTDYFHYVLLARITREYFKSKASGSAGNMPKVNQHTVASTLIPLPPLPSKSLSWSGWRR